MLATGTFFQDSDEGVPDTSLLLLAAARLRSQAKEVAFLTKHIGSELPQLEHPTGRNPFTREILGQTPADRVAKLAAGEVPNAAPWREQVAEWLRLLEL